MTLDEVISLLMSDIIIKKSSGPRTVPWGTPLKTGLFISIKSTISEGCPTLLKDFLRKQAKHTRTQSDSLSNINSNSTQNVSIGDDTQVTNLSLICALHSVIFVLTWSGLTDFRYLVLWTAP